MHVFMAKVTDIENKGQLPHCKDYLVNLNQFWKIDLQIYCANKNELKTPKERNSGHPFLHKTPRFFILTYFAQTLFIPPPPNKYTNNWKTSKRLTDLFVTTMNKILIIIGMVEPHMPYQRVLLLARIQTIKTLKGRFLVALVL